MNKTLFIIRKVKGMSQKKMAETMGLELAVYKELECAFIKVTPELASKLEDLYSVPSEYFMAYNKQGYGQEYVNLLEREKQKLDSPKYDNVPAGTHIALATLTMESLITSQRLIMAYELLLDTQMQNDALRELYNSLRKQPPESKS